MTRESRGVSKIMTLRNATKKETIDTIATGGRPRCNIWRHKAEMVSENVFGSGGKTADTNSKRIWWIELGGTGGQAQKGGKRAMNLEKKEEGFSLPVIEKLETQADSHRGGFARVKEPILSKAPGGGKTQQN